MERFLYQKNINKNPKINLWWAYGGVESFAMSTLGYLSIFKDLDLNPDLYVERIYSDTQKTIVAPKDVDCIGFSIGFELDILNIIKMLEKYSIPLKAKEREEGDPIVFAGGSALISNPYPYEDFFDFIVLSEKVILKEIFEILAQKNTLKRSDILKNLSKIKGVYVPEYPAEKIEIVRDNLKEEILYTPVLSDKSFFKGTFIIELERGCPKMCNFCTASWHNYPTRFCTFENIKKALDLGLQYTNKIALLGAYVAGHPDFSEIIEYISKKEEIELTISSLRADLADEKLIRTLVQCGQKTATVALEAGSESLRKFIDKDLSDEQFVRSILSFARFGLKGVKIYAMTGLPEETAQDMEALVDLVKNIKTKLKKEGFGAFAITVSLSTYIPKPNTPFEYCKRLDKKTLEERVGYLKKEFHKIGVTFRAPSIEWDMVQAILSRYDNSLSDFLIDAAHEGANLGAFKKVWRRYNKKGILPDFESCAKFPLNNIKTQNFKWNNISPGAESIKSARQAHLYRS